ncbi:uncharacterized protein [Palaemon carinicauda]|uniref:uncharacterized protein n=1 Tax=Palaemon carinicauda TaxID=392227 RepID=UPI0035B652D4
MTGPPMRIHLKEDVKPFALYTTRLIPLAFQEDVKIELETIVAQGIIEPVVDQPSPWCHPLVVVAKPTGGVFVTTDLSKYSMDALCGYWQIPLAEEDQALTTFITPYGRYCYRRSPMGFSASEDACCRRGDIALQGIQQCVKMGRQQIHKILSWKRFAPQHVRTPCTQEFSRTLPTDSPVSATISTMILPYWKIREDLYTDDDLVLYGSRIVIPLAMRRSVLRCLHDSHCGVEATKRRAKQTVYWPGINSDIENNVHVCELCQLMQPSQQQEPLLCNENPSRPFESVSADFFSVAGKSFLVYVDRLSGWPVVVKFGTNTTAEVTTRHFSHIFRDLGVPVRLRTDGGPQFTSSEFKNFLTRWGVQHVISTPYYPQSNGHAEAAVKKVKHFILKVAPSGNIDAEDFDKGFHRRHSCPPLRLPQGQGKRPEVRSPSRRMPHAFTFPMPHATLLLSTDASYVAIGAVLE